jgi:hypothetical protein
VAGVVVCRAAACCARGACRVGVPSGGGAAAGTDVAAAGTDVAAGAGTGVPAGITVAAGTGARAGGRVAGVGGDKPGRWRGGVVAEQQGQVDPGAQQIQPAGGALRLPLNTSAKGQIPGRPFTTRRRRRAAARETGAQPWS